MKSRPSRREQILAGNARGGSPCDGVNDRRNGSRSLPPIGLGRPAIGGRMGLTHDLSEHGLAVAADIALDVGDSVPVKFAGAKVFGARIAWKKNGIVGLAVCSGLKERERS